MMNFVKGKALAVEEAIKVFQSISQPDTISYNTMSLYLSSSLVF